MGKTHGECAYCEPNTYKEGKFICSKKSGIWDEVRVYGDDSADNCTSFCPRFSQDKGLSEKCIKDSKEYRKANSSSERCYITTVAVKYAGLSDDCTELNDLRWFRNNVMQKNEKYKNMLLDYDTRGQMISSILDIKSRTEDPEIFANRIKTLLVYIKGTSRYVSRGREYINNGDKEAAEKYFDKAVILYTEMVENLSNQLLSNYYQGNKLQDGYDYANAGHGTMAKH